jgi:hypothetical protein
MAAPMTAASLQALLAAASAPGGTPTANAVPSLGTDASIATPDPADAVLPTSEPMPAIAGPGALRPGLGERRPPQYSSSLAALQRAVY